MKFTLWGKQSQFKLYAKSQRESWKLFEVCRYTILPCGLYIHTLMRACVRACVGVCGVCACTLPRCRSSSIVLLFLLCRFKMEEKCTFETWSLKNSGKSQLATICSPQAHPLHRHHPYILRGIQHCANAYDEPHPIAPHPTTLNRGGGKGGVLMVANGGIVTAKDCVFQKNQCGKLAPK